jgi:hypothetical protein
MADPLLDALLRRSTPPKRTRYVSVLSKVAILLLFILVTGFLLINGVHRFRELTTAIQAIPDLRDRYNLQNELVKDLFQIAGALLILLGFYFTNRTIAVSREGQVTDRFNKAIDHLGNDKVEIRIGGICALARIARDSRKDRVEIAELLCAFIQQNTEARSESALRRDIRSALRTIGSRDWTDTLPDSMVDLSGTHLPKADLRALRFDSASFAGADLRGANFENASLRSCDFAGAQCAGAYFRNADLRDANLTAADFSDASLRDSQLSGASLLGSNLCNASLIGAKMGAARFVTLDQIRDAIVDGATELPTFDVVPLSDD